jgi:hypothetical protein
MIYVQWPTSSALVARIDQIRAAARPGGRANTRALGDIRQIVEDDHKDKMLRDVDRYGKTRAELAESTLRNPHRGGGPSLIPQGERSRFITNFEAVWQPASNGLNYLAMRFVDIVNKRGQPFAHYHLTGASKPGTNWVLPKRDVGGITPAGWAKIKARMSRFAADVLRGG